MSTGYHIVVCGGIAPDPLQRLEPQSGPKGPELKNELMLPAVLDPWAASALFEAAELAKQHEGSKVWLVAAGPKAKLQQVMMVIGQKASFELVAVDAPINGFTEAFEVAAALAEAIQGIAELDHSKLLLFGGWESATRGAGATLQMVGERLQIRNQFQGVDKLSIQDDGSLKILERVEGGKHLVSLCQSAPAVLGWATGELPEPPNNPQVGMTNMRSVMPALQRAQATQLSSEGVSYSEVALPSVERETRVVKDVPATQIAEEIVEWLSKN